MQEQNTKKITKCAEEFLKSEQRMPECREYCGMFRINHNNYFFEGYPEFFANTLVYLKKFEITGITIERLLIS